MRIPKWPLIVTFIWAALPWIFRAICKFHPPDHADPFWMPSMPFVFISFIPMELAHLDANSHEWFPLNGVIASSLFNLTIGVGITMFYMAVNKRR